MSRSQPADEMFIVSSSANIRKIDISYTFDITINIFIRWSWTGVFNNLRKIDRATYSTHTQSFYLLYVACYRSISDEFTLFQYCVLNETKMAICRFTFNSSNLQLINYCTLHLLIQKICIIISNKLLHLDIQIIIIILGIDKLYCNNLLAFIHTYINSLLFISYILHILRCSIIK